MTKTFVAIDDPIHRLIRNITREVPLQPGHTGRRQPAIVYDVEEQDLPQDYLSLAMLHSIGGMPYSSLAITNWKARDEDRLGIAEQVNFFDAAKLDRRCSRDLRLKASVRGAGMLSGELLAYGTGMLRARNDDPKDDLQRYIRTQHGRITSHHEVVYARVMALHQVPPNRPQPVEKESYDSTNLIYGDALGEIEQLWERRAETSFLEAVAQSLEGLRQRGQVAGYLNPPLNLPRVMHHHFKAQSLWNRPPMGARGLLRRLECILDNLVIDDQRPKQAASLQTEARPPADSSLGSLGDSGWEDSSGYDGWLSSGEDT